MLRLLTSSLLVTLSGASFCGDSTVPFSLEILASGQPVLGCARPTCFGWAPNGQPATQTGAFYRINDVSDGFIRPGPFSIPPFGPTDARYYKPYAALCDLTFTSASCPGANQWVGGIAPQLNVTYPTVLQCCAYDGLLLSEDRGIATLVGGQAVVGGEVIAEGLQVGFDYISNLAKVVKPDGTVQYDVAVRRMPCADPTGANAKIAKNEAAQAFQAPNLPVEDPLPLPPAQPAGPVPPAGPAATNQILEEVIQEEAFQLPPGTQFQPPPPPQFQPPPPPPQFQPPVAFQPQFVPQPAYNPPVAFYGGGGGGNAQWCFSGDMTVRTIDGGVKRMDELKKNDWVMAINDEHMEYVPVEFWLHRVPTQEAEFNVFETEDGKTIKITDKHYIFKGDCSRVGKGALAPEKLLQDAVTADQIRAGDCLYTMREDKQLHEKRVVRTDKVKDTGIYAPMTSSGRIIVNDIHASCHNIMQAHTVGTTVFGFVDIINDVYDAVFGSDPMETVETPSGLNTILAIADLIIPKNMISM